MTQKLCILVVDDHPVVRRALCRALHEHQVVEAAGYDEAERILAVTPVDLVVSDYHMPPGRNGVAMLTEVAKIRPGARRFLLSGDPPAGIKRLVEEGLIHRVYVKPCGPELLDDIEALASEHGSGPQSGDRLTGPPTADVQSASQQTDPAAA